MINPTPLKDKKIPSGDDIADFLYLVSIAKEEARRLGLFEAVKLLDMATMSAYLEFSGCKIEDIDDNQELDIVNMLDHVSSG